MVVVSNGGPNDSNGVELDMKDVIEGVGDKLWEGVSDSCENDDVDEGRTLTSGVFTISPLFRLGKESKDNDELKSDGDGIHGYAIVVEVDEVIFSR